MIQDLKQKISHFRSELLMGRYPQAYQQGYVVMELIEKIMAYGIEIDNLSLIFNDIKQEVQIAEKLLSIIEVQKPSKTKEKPEKKPVSKGRPSFKSKGKSVGKSTGKNERVVSQNKKNPKAKQKEVEKANTEEKTVSKWGNKKQSPTKKNRTQTFKEEKREEFGHRSQNLQNKNEEQEDENDDECLPISDDEKEILEREVILPLTLPQFFKGKQHHRLIVVYYSKCTDLLQKIAEALAGKFVPIQLEDIEHWSGSDCESGSEKIKIYIVPYTQGCQQLIRAILESSNSLLVMYSGNNRQIYTQKFSTIKNSGYRLKF